MANQYKLIAKSISARYKTKYILYAVFTSLLSTVCTIMITIFCDFTSIKEIQEMDATDVSTSIMFVLSLLMSMKLNTSLGQHIDVIKSYNTIYSQTNLLLCFLSSKKISNDTFKNIKNACVGLLESLKTNMAESIQQDADDEIESWSKIPETPNTPEGFLNYIMDSIFKKYEKVLNDEDRDIVMGFITTINPHIQALTIDRELGTPPAYVTMLKIVYVIFYCGFYPLSLYHTRRYYAITDVTLSATFFSCLYYMSEYVQNPLVTGSADAVV
jgi:quinol-cytochrome oxidoreductase complex cytochrome b subunit